MLPKMKLQLEDLQVTSFAPEDDPEGVSGVQAAYPTSYCNTLVVATCRIGGCPSAAGGPICHTVEYDGSTCETGPVYYC